MKNVCKIKILNNFQKKYITNTSEDINRISRKHTIYSWSAQAKINPIAMTKAKGCYFWDAEGKKYFDLNSQLMCVNIGHGHPKVIQAIKDQADELAFAGPAFSTRVRAEIGPLLSKYTPGDLNHFFFTLGGAEAVENAIKFAKHSSKRTKIISRYKSYHGATQGAISLTGDPRRWPNEPSLPGVIKVFDPYKYRSHLYKEGMSDEEFSFKILAQLEETLMYENPESVAAIFLEPVTGTNGIIPPPNGYLEGVRNLCDKYGILMVCDEVMSGFGRTGEWFAVDHWKVIPDMITMAKGITSAYLPLGAVAVSPKIYKHFEENVFEGGLTYQAHPMSLAASVAVLKVMEEEKIVENAKNMGIVMRSMMERLKEKHPCVGEVRSIGLFGAFELVKNKNTKEPISKFNAPISSSEAMSKVAAYLRANGIFAFISNNLIHSNPPLIVNEKELTEAYEVIDKALDIADKYTL
jgi:taurine--2-oxoglutarate transaminase